MLGCALLCVLGALLQGEAKILYSRVSVEEGRTLTLRCAFPASDSSALQWLTPKGYVTFFNSEKVLKDRRFQLIKSSRNRLVISISNVTGDDEGIYTCFHYSMPVKTKKVNVTVWAAPSKPVIDIARIPGKRSKNEVLLNCSTSGGWPCPRITWLIDHTELSGNTKASLERGNEKCAVSSTLRINAFTHRSTVTCVVRHRSFSMGNSTATFNLSNLLADTDARDTPSDPTTAQTPHSAEVTSMGRSTTWENAMTDQEQENITAVTSLFGGETLPAGNHTTQQNKTTEPTPITFAERNTTWENAMTDEDGENITTATGFLGGETSPAGDHTTQHNETTESVTYSAFTDGNTTRYIDFNNVTEMTRSRTVGFGASRGKSNSTVILILVSLMICVLLVTVQLFIMKLKKAHKAWKKENESSDQTVESNRSKSNNEDIPGQARNGNAATNQNGSGIKYNNQVSV